MTEEEAEQLKDERRESSMKETIVECLAKRYSNEESLDYINDKLGIELN